MSYSDLAEHYIRNANGIVINNKNADKEYVGHKEVLDFMIEEQQRIDNLDPEIKKLKPKAYFRIRPENLIPNVIKCFEENIYDIPEGSIIWDTPLLKETMSHYKALKDYAQEQGWLCKVA